MEYIKDYKAKTMQEWLEVLARYPNAYASILVNMTREHVEYGTPGYELLFRIDWHINLIGHLMAEGPRLSNGMFLSMGQDAE